MYQVLIADDHAVVRRGVREMIEEMDEKMLVHEAGTGQEIFSKVESDEFHLLLLDMALPDMPGLTVLDQLRSIAPTMPVLILSMYPEKQFAVRALKLGAAGYLTKDRTTQELVLAVQTILSGGKYITPSLAAQMANDLAGESKTGSAHKNLSDREFQVLLLLAEGKTISDVAEHLGISVKTVSTYRRRLLDKLNLDNTHELIAYAFRQNLVN